MFYSVREYRGRKGEPKGIGWRDLCDLLVRAHIQLGGPIVLVWDNLRMHLADRSQHRPPHGRWNMITAPPRGMITAPALSARLHSLDTGASKPPKTDGRQPSARPF
ncbi:hypothetical protein AB0C86_35870 [Streptomyces lavendulae]